MNTEVEFAHLGVNVSNKETTRKLHNRAATKFRLRDFSDFNLTAGDEMVAVQCSKDQLQLSKKMKPLDNPQECVKAVYNYAAMHGQFHPMDWSPKALLKMMLNKLFEGPPRLTRRRYLCMKCATNQCKNHSACFLRVFQIIFSYQTDIK